MHDALDDVPFEDDPVDRLGRKSEDFLALREPKFRLLALGDIARVDDDAADYGVGERGNTARLQPAVRSVLVTQAKLAREALDIAVNHLLILRHEFRPIIRMRQLEYIIRFAFFGRVAQRILHTRADVLHAAISGCDGDDVLCMFGEREESAFATPKRAILIAPFGDFETENNEARDPRGTLQRPHIDLEAPRGTIG